MTASGLHFATLVTQNYVDHILLFLNYSYYERSVFEKKLISRGIKSSLMMLPGSK